VDSGPNFGVLYTTPVASKPATYHPVDVLVMPVDGPLATAGTLRKYQMSKMYY
jgi:hypothetical protein